MLCFGKSHKSFAKTIRENFTDNSSAVHDCPQTASTQRAIFRKSKLTSNTDSGLYSDESGPEDRPNKINPDKLLIRNTPSSSESRSSPPCTPHPLSENRVGPSLTKPPTPDSWYEANPLLRRQHQPYHHSRGVNLIEGSNYSDRNSLTLDTPQMQRSLKKIRSMSLNNSDKNMANSGGVAESHDSQHSSQKTSKDLNRYNSDCQNSQPVKDSNRTPVVKINREAFERLNFEYLSEYDSEEEMEKTLAECIALDELKKSKINANCEDSNFSNRSSASSAIQAQDNGAARISINLPEALYSEVMKNRDAKIVNNGIQSPTKPNGSLVDETKIQCHLLRQKTLQSLHSLLDQVDAFLSEGGKPFKTSHVIAMKSLCTILTENLSIFEKLGAQVTKSEDQELVCRENVNKCVAALAVIKDNILNYNNLLSSISIKESSEQIFSASVASILSYTKNIPDLIRSIDHSISKKQESKSDNLVKSPRNNNALIIFNHSDEKINEMTENEKAAKPKDLDLVQNINDNHIYDEVAVEPSSSNSKSILSELNSMIVELTNCSSTPVKREKKYLTGVDLTEDPLYEQISPIKIDLNESEVTNTKKDINNEDKYTYNLYNFDKKSIINDIHSEKLPLKIHNSQKNVGDINKFDLSKKNSSIETAINIRKTETTIPDYEIELANNDQERVRNLSAASLLDLETKFANMLSILSASKDSLLCHELKPHNRSLNDLREAKKEKSTDCDSALIPLLCVHG